MSDIDVGVCVVTLKFCTTAVIRGVHGAKQLSTDGPHLVIGRPKFVGTLVGWRLECLDHCKRGGGQDAAVSGKRSLQLLHIESPSVILGGTQS